MRRKDREVTDPDAIIDILNECTTLRLSMNGRPYPYTVPVSFGLECCDGALSIYIHCAPVGMKLDRIVQDSGICFEGDIFLGYEMTEHGITARYKSVIGTGRCTEVKDAQEKLEGLHRITEHCGFADYPIDRCAGLQNLKILKISVDGITGKINLPGQLTTADKQI